MSEQDPMTATPVEFEPAQASPERAAGQVDDAGWPKPGEEGYVHPDGTPQSVAQLAGNRQAAADRAAAGSIVHGAPAVQRGGDPDATSAAAARAAAYSGPSTDDRDEALSRSVGQALADNPNTPTPDGFTPTGDTAAADRSETPKQTKRAGGTTER